MVYMIYIYVTYHISICIAYDVYIIYIYISSYFVSYEYICYIHAQRGGRSKVLPSSVVFNRRLFAQYNSAALLLWFQCSKEMRSDADFNYCMDVWHLLLNLYLMQYITRFRHFRHNILILLFTILLKKSQYPLRYYCQHLVNYIGNFGNTVIKYKL